MTTHFRQNDPRWAGVKIRGTDLKLKDYGCLICSIAILSTQFGDNFGPIGAMDMTGFTEDGKVIFRSGNYPSFEFDKIIKGRDDEMIKEAIKDDDRAVILGLNGGAHWVVATLYMEDLKTFEIADPLTRQPSSQLPDRDEITYMAFYKRKK